MESPIAILISEIPRQIPNPTVDRREPFRCPFWILEISFRNLVAGKRELSSFAGRKKLERRVHDCSMHGAQSRASCDRSPALGDNHRFGATLTNANHSSFGWTVEIVNHAVRSGLLPKLCRTCRQRLAAENRVAH